MRRALTSDLLCAFGLLLFIPAVVLENYPLVGVAGTAYLLGYLMDPVEDL